MKSEKDSYRQIRVGEKEEIKVKGSRFIAEAIPVMNEYQVSESVEAVKKGEYNATHHCWAYRLGATGEAFRYNDDGEPGGTAGQPILRQIDRLGLTNTLVIVTRYYGGTKLGMGGLARAYGEAARLVLEKSPIRTNVVREAVRIIFEYEDTSPAMHTINQFDVVIESSTYHERTELDLTIRASHVKPFIEMYAENLSGRGVVLRSN